MTSAQPRFSLRSLLGDSGAVMLASIAAILAGTIRTKFAAVELGSDAVAVLAQLTQLYILVLTISVVGLGTGIRVVLARILDEDQAIGLGRLLVAAVTGISLVLVVVVEVFAEPIAQQLLGSSGDAHWVRVAVLAVPFAVAMQTAAAVVQARGEFRGLARASLLGGLLAAVATVLLMLPGDLGLAVASLPVSALCQLAPVFLVTRTGRRLLRAALHVTRPHLVEVVSIGAITFGMTVVSSSADTVLRARFIDVGGLDIVARLQPALVLSTQGFGLVLGALGATVLVRVTEQIAAHPGSDMSAAFNAIARRLLVVVGVVALGLQAGAGLAVVVLFSHDFLSSTALIAGMACGDLLRAFAWIFGATLLPQRLRLRWAVLGLAVTLVQFALAWVLLPRTGAAGYVTAYVVAWVVGSVLTVLLAGRAVRVEPLTCALAAVLAAALAGVTVVVTASPERLVQLVPFALAVLLLVAGLTVHGRRGGTVLSDLRDLARGGGR